MKRSRYYSNFKKIVGGSLFFMLFILMIVLLAKSVNREVTQTEYAIGYKTFDMEFTKVYEQGRYVTGVAEHWTIVKRTLQEMGASGEECLTNDKVLVDLTYSLQFAYLKQDLISILKRQFHDDDNYKKMLKDRVESSIATTCTKYDAEDFYNSRSTIDEAMFANLLSIVNDQNIGIEIAFFQLQNIAFPTEFSDLIELKQNTEQEAQTAINDRESILTQANTRLLEAQRTAEIILIDANNVANITLNAATTNSTAQQKVWSNRALAYAHTQKTLGYNGSDTVAYIVSENVQVSGNLVTVAS